MMDIGTVWLDNACYKKLASTVCVVPCCTTAYIVFVIQEASKHTAIAIAAATATTQCCNQ